MPAVVGTVLSYSPFSLVLYVYVTVPKAAVAVGALASSPYVQPVIAKPEILLVALPIVNVYDLAVVVSSDHM